MNIQNRILHRISLLLCSLVLLTGTASMAHSTDKGARWTVATVMAPAAAPAASTAAPAAPATPSDAAQAADADESDDSKDSEAPRHHHHNHVHSAHGHDDALVNIAHDSTLAQGQHADNVVSVLGSSTSAGDVSDSVVSVFGNTRVSGTVGDSAVAVLGNVYVDGKVGGDVVAVLGSIELGPHAEVSGDLVSVGGTVKRDPAAITHGDVQNVGIGGHWNGIDGLQPWLKHCLFLGRPLAFAPGLGWAWTLALVALAIYLLLAAMFGSVVDTCVQTLEAHPGQSLLSAILTMLAVPIVIVMLCITVVGIVAVPFIGFAVLLIQVFGKLVMLAWIGRRLSKSVALRAASQTVMAVLVGGLIVLVLYTVPVLGFILYKLLGIIGVGVVVYTLLLQMQGRRAARQASAAPAEAAGVSPAAGAASAATPTAATPASPEPAASSSIPSQGAAEAPPAPSAAPTSRQVPAASAILLPRAGFWIRMVALLFDAILIALVLHLLQDSNRLFLVILACYGAIMWKLRGTTVGGIIFNLQVVQHDGQEMEWSTVIVRALSSFLSLVAIGLGFIWIAVDQENRAWHDKIAGTIVVRVP